MLNHRTARTNLWSRGAQNVTEKHWELHFPHRVMKGCYSELLYNGRHSLSVKQEQKETAAAWMKFQKHVKVQWSQCLTHNQIKTKNNSPLESSTLGWAARMALLRKPVWCLAQSIAMAITKWREGFPDWKEENIPEWRQWNLRREAEASQKQNRAKWKIFLFWSKTLKTELICWFHSLSSNVNVSRLNVLTTAKENSL